MTFKSKLIQIFITLNLSRILGCGMLDSATTLENPLMENLEIFMFPATSEEICKDFTDNGDAAIKHYEESAIVLSGIVESVKDEQENDCPYLILKGGETSTYKIKICLKRNLLPSDTIELDKNINLIVKYLTSTSTTVLLKQID